MKIFKGKKISGGITIGPIFHLKKNDFFIPQHSIKEENIEKEFLLLDKAVEKCLVELDNIKALALEHLDEDNAKIIEGQKMVISDQFVLTEIKDYTKTHKKNIVFSYFHVLSKYEDILQKSFSQYHQERKGDLEDVKRRIIHHLISDEVYYNSTLTKPSIFISRRISPSDLLQLDHKNVLGIISEIGGENSHVAILAKAFRIPYLSGVKKINEIIKFEKIILDADENTILAGISEKNLNYYKKREKLFLENKRKKITEITKETKDKVPFNIFLNIGFLDELKMYNHCLTEVGLFRTEFLSIEKNSIPKENDQFNIYKKVVQEANGHKVIFRTFDFGRDKFVEMLDLNIFHGDESFDDWGGIQFCLENPEILRSQFRALLRASKYGPISIMIPMISTINEIMKTKQIFAEACNELDEINIEYDKHVELGIMVETKKILDILDEAAEEVAFFSIGTNDLAYFLFGSKREDGQIKNHYHPQMFSSIKKIVECGKKHNIPVTVCGEMGSDRYSILGLIAVGIRRISVNPGSLNTINSEIKKISINKIEKIQDKIINGKSAFMVFSFLKDFYYNELSDSY